MRTALEQRIPLQSMDTTTDTVAPFI